MREFNEGKPCVVCGKLNTQYYMSKKCAKCRTKKCAGNRAFDKDGFRRKCD